MKLILSKQEFLQLRDIIINIDNDKVKEEFNRIVINKNPHIDTSTTSETVSMTISDELSSTIGNILIAHSKGFGKNLNISLTGIPKIISQAKKLFSDLGTAISGIKK